MSKCRYYGGYGEPWEFAEQGENGIHQECVEYEEEEEQATKHYMEPVDVDHGPDFLDEPFDA